MLRADGDPAAGPPEAQPTARHRRSTCVYISRAQRIKVCTSRHDWKIELCRRILADECLYARPYRSEAERREARRSRSGSTTTISTDHTPPAPPGPHASTLASTT